MQKSKSASLSEKQKQKIISIIHSKVTPLKFKFIKNDKHIQMNLSLLPQLQKSQNSQTDQAKAKKRISISTYINTNCPFAKDAINQVRPRQSVLSTESIKKQQEMLTSLLNQSSMKQIQPNSNNSNGLAEPFKNLPTTLTFQHRQKLMSQINLLQRKKMLKNLKQDVQKKKTQLLLEMINQRQIKKQQKQLHKKYNPNMKHAFRQSCHRSTEANELLNLYSQQRIKQSQMGQKNKPFRNSLGFCIQNTDQNYEDQPQNNKRSDSSINEAKEVMMLKDFIDFFREDEDEARRIKLEQVHKLRNQKSSKYLHHQSFVHSMATNQKDESTRKISMPINYDVKFRDSLSKNTRKRQRHGFINKTVHFGADQQKQNDLQQMSPTLANAKLRMKSNHKKIVNLGKIHKTSSLGKASR